VTAFVEVFQVQRIIPYLIECSTVKSSFTYFELDDKHNRAAQYHGVNPPSHSWDAELEKEGAWHALEVFSQQLNLNQPGVSLCRKDGKIATLRQSSYHGIGIRLKEFRKGRTIPGSR
jgi:hypothetical protein